MAAVILVHLTTTADIGLSSRSPEMVRAFVRFPHRAVGGVGVPARSAMVRWAGGGIIRSSVTVT